MGDLDPCVDAAPARQQPARRFAQTVNRLATALLPDEKLTESAAALADELLDDHGRGHVLRRELAFELAAARTRLRAHQALLDDLLTTAVKTGTTPPVLRVLTELVGREEKHLLRVLDLCSRMGATAPRVTVNAQNAAVLLPPGSAR